MGDARISGHGVNRTTVPVGPTTERQGDRRKVEVVLGDWKRGGQRCLGDEVVVVAVVVVEAAMQLRIVGSGLSQYGGFPHGRDSRMGGIPVWGRLNQSRLRQLVREMLPGEPLTIAHWGLASLQILP